MYVRHVLGFLLILNLSVLTCAGQSRPSSRATYALTGTVRDDTDQHAMENVRVDLQSGSGIPMNNTFTRGSGEFEFNGLTNGEYIVEVIVKDYETAQQRVSVTGVDRRGVFIFMTRPMSVTRSTSGASISAHELSVPPKAHDEYEKGMNLLYRKLDSKGAIVQFQRAVKDFPTFYEAYAQEGAAYLQLGDTASAEEAMKKSVDLSSGQYSKALFMLAALLSETKRYSEAAAIARKGIAADDNAWQGPFELAKALLGLQQEEEARKCAVQARDMKPDNPAIYLLLANILIHLRDYPGLVKDLDAYLKLVPIGPEADQARKARNEIQASLQQPENPAQISAEEKDHPKAQDSTRTTAPTPVRESAPPPPDPDESGLPALPPPVSLNY